MISLVQTLCPLDFIFNSTLIIVTILLPTPLFIAVAVTPEVEKKFKIKERVNKWMGVG